MKKEEIFKKLDELELDKEQYVIISGASLIVQDIIEETSDIDLSCSMDYYNEIKWDTKNGFFNTEIKYKDCYEISYNFFDLENIVMINGYKFMNLDKCLELKKKENKKKDQKLIKKLDLELCLKDNYRYERQLKNKGIHLIGGVDEVGRGPLVGPVVAACVILPEKFDLDGLTDSKKISEKKRDEFYDKIMRQAISIGIGVIDHKKIDEVNIYEATKLAMKNAVDNCAIKPEHILIDAMPLELDIPTTSIIKGDLKSITISAASVIAKVTRDRMLIELDKKYPMYDFKNNKGYPTKKHVEAIKKYGIIDKHRRSYEPVSSYIKENNL